jgi:hypothetical protein
MSDFEKLINFLARENYGNLFTPLCGLIAIVTGFLFVQKNKVTIFFLIYLIIDFIFSLCDTYLQTFSSFSKYQIFIFITLTNTIISLAELLTYYYFFSKIIKNKSILRVMKILGFSFFLITVLLETTRFAFLTPRLIYIADVVGALEFLFLVPPSFVYFYELLKNDPVVNLYQRPSFWIVTGILFYSVISIPYLLIDRFVYDNQYEHRYLLDLAFFYIPFSLNLIFLTRAFLCKKTLTI